MCVVFLVELPLLKQNDMLVLTDSDLEVDESKSIWLVKRKQGTSCEIME